MHHYHLSLSSQLSTSAFLSSPLWLSSLLNPLQWGFIKWWAKANIFQCCPRAEGPRATLENIGWGSPLDKFIVKLQTLSPSRQHWKISPARQNWLLSLRQSCYFTMILVLGLSVLASTSLWMSVVLDTTQSAQWLFITHGVLVNPQKGGQGKNTQSCFSFSWVLQE